MSWTSRPFDYYGTSPTQILDDLTKANDNFEILGQAFVNNNPITQMAKNADRVDGYHASQTPSANTIPVAKSDGKLDPGWLPVLEYNHLAVPYWRVSVDTTSSSRTSPSVFNVVYQFYFASYGRIWVYSYSFGAWSLLFEMRIHCPTTMSVSQRIFHVDDNVYIFLNGSQIASATGSGSKNVLVSYDFVSGENLIQIVLNNSGGGATGLCLMGDFLIELARQNRNVKFIPL